MKYLIIVISLLSLVSCGTFTPRVKKVHKPVKSKDARTLTLDCVNHLLDKGVKPEMAHKICSDIYRRD